MLRRKFININTTKTLAEFDGGDCDDERSAATLHASAVHVIFKWKRDVNVSVHLNEKPVAKEN